MSILADFYTDDIIKDPKYKLSPSGIYYAPPKGKYEDYLEFIKVSMQCNSYLKVASSVIVNSQCNSRLKVTGPIVVNVQCNPYLEVFSSQYDYLFLLRESLSAIKNSTSNLFIKIKYQMKRRNLIN